MDQGDRSGGDTVNVFRGNAEIVVQFRDNYGDVHVHAPSHRRAPREEAANALAEAVFRQWREEAKVWDVGGDRPMLAVRWRPRERRADHAENVGGAATVREFQVDDLLSTLLDRKELPSRRLAVLGSAGAGKTALAVLLTLEMLKRGLSAEQGPAGGRFPVPVLFSLASWDPDREELGAWFVRRLHEDYPGLPRINGRHPARELWNGADSRLLPVLDGLDEMPRDRQAAAVKCLNRALYDRGVILTSRTSEFDALSRELAVRSAAVIEARPVDVGDALGYLGRSVTPDALPRWAPLFREMRTHPDGTLAEALSTPLMLWLARTVYDRPSHDPAELTQASRFPSRRSVEEHLLDRLVPVAFAGDVPSDDRWDPPRRWSPDSAQRYLRYLAGHLQRRGTSELAWWRLYQATLPRMMALPALVLLGLGLSGAVGWLQGLTANAYSDDLVWGGAMLPLDVAVSLGSGLTFGLGIQAVVRFWFGNALFSEPRRRASLLRPGAALRSAIRSTTPGRAAAAGTPVLLITAFYLWPVGSSAPPDLSAALRVQVVGWLVAIVVTVLFAAPSTTDDEATTPVSLMRGEHVSVLLTLCVTSAMIGIGVGLVRWLQSPVAGAASMIAAWLGAAAMLLLVSPWSRWLLAKVCLTPAGRVPWSLLRFLRDAHRQGVLRQVGATYQFRNMRLQERLAKGTREARTPFLRGIRQHRPVLPADAVATLPYGGVVIRQKKRRLVLAPLVAAAPITALHTLLRITQEGIDVLPLIWAPAAFFFSIGGFFTAAAYVMPRRTTVLTVTPHHVEAAVGFAWRVRYDWNHVDEVAVRRTRRRGFDTRMYGIHVRLGPDAPRPRFARNDGDWYIVCDIGLNPALPWQTEQALRDFAAERWRPPVLSALSDTGSGREWSPPQAEPRASPSAAQLPPPTHEVRPRGRWAPAKSNANADFAQWEQEVGEVLPKPGHGTAPGDPPAVPDATASPHAPRTAGTPADWVQAAGGFVAATTATLTVLIERLLPATTGSAGVPVWCPFVALLGYLMLCGHGPRLIVGVLRVFLDTLQCTAMALGLSAGVAVTVPADSLGWTDVFGLVVFGFGTLACGVRVSMGRDTGLSGQAALLVTGLGLLGMGLLAPPAAAASSGIVSFLAYTASGLLTLIGVIATALGPDLSSEGTSASADRVPDWFALVRYATAVPVTLAGAAYAAVAGGTVACWLLAAAAVLLTALLSIAPESSPKKR